MPLSAYLLVDVFPETQLADAVGAPCQTGGVLRVGLTGGIGSGKSTVSRRLAERGAVVVDSDAIAREVVEPGTTGLAAVVDAFGPDVLDADGRLDRPRLGSLVFADESARRRLNEIVHPLVGRRAAELMDAAGPTAIVVHDVPLLVENGLAPAYHLVIVVEAPEHLRVDRLVRDRAMSEADARARLSTQAGDEQRRAVADVLLGNVGTVGELEAAVDKLWEERIRPYADNLSRGKRSGSPATVISAYDRSWPVQFHRLADRVRHAVGDLRVDHVGSTAVRGLAAKDVIDIQLTVSSMEQADQLRGVLEGAGFPAAPDIRGDRPKEFDPDPAHWAKRLHGSADPGRPANLHLRVAGSAGWRYALLFRDWLRAVAAERSAYQAEKRRLAGANPSQEDYAEAKEPWFDAALPRAQRWAQDVRWRP